MSINSLSVAMSAGVYVNNNSKLPQWVLDKLNELGVDPSDVSSLAQAKEIIMQAENSSETNNGNEQSHESPNLRKKAEALAKKLGINVEETDTIDDILENIQSVLDTLLKVAVNNNDEALFNEVQECQAQLQILQTEKNGGGISNNVVYSFMDMVASQNKFALGLDL